MTIASVRSVRVDTIRIDATTIIVRTFVGIVAGSSPGQIKATPTRTVEGSIGVGANVATASVVCQALVCI